MKTYEQFQAALPPSKKGSDTLLAKLFLRQMSMPVSWWMYRVGFSGNGTSLLAIVLGTTAMPLLAIGGGTGGVAAIVLLSVVALLDCVDGNIARASGATGPKGEWIDAVAGYLVYALLPIAVGVRAGMGEEGLQGLPILFGALASTLNVFTRLMHQKYETAMLKSPVGKSSELRKGGSFVGFVSGELGFCGIMIPALAASLWFGREIWFVGGYALIYTGVAVGFMTLKLASVFRS